MYKLRLLQPDRILISVLISLSLLGFVFIGYQIGQSGVDWFLLLIAGSIFAILSLVILQNPYIGIVITLASLALLDLLPSIPYASSIVALIGGVTLASSILRKLHQKQELTITVKKNLIWGLLFIVWVFASNPAIALLPSDGERNWLFTFLQLWILAFLASNLVNNPRKHQILIWAFVVASVVSATYATQAGHIGVSVQDSVRSGGLSGGVNAAARFFIVSLVFLHYLRGTSTSTSLRFALTLGLGVVIFGIFSTISRTGILLLISAVGMLSLQRLGEKRRRQAGFLLLIAIIVTWVFADNVIIIFQGILPAIRLGTDTVGVRYTLIESGIKMWIDNIVTGVGIGQYPQQLIYYARNLLPSARLQVGAHNMYIQVLSETGLVGMILFLGMLITSFRSLFMATRADDDEISSLAKVWLVAFLLLLIGGFTKHDLSDKLIWLTLGISASFETILSAEKHHVSSSNDYTAGLLKAQNLNV